MDFGLFLVQSVQNSGTLQLWWKKICLPVNMSSVQQVKERFIWLLRLSHMCLPSPAQQDKEQQPAVPKAKAQRPTGVGPTAVTSWAQFFHSFSSAALCGNECTIR